MKHFVVKFQDDIAGFVGGSTFATVFGISFINDLIHGLIIAFFGGIVGVVGKEVGVGIIKAIQFAKKKIKCKKK